MRWMVPRLRLSVASGILLPLLVLLAWLPGVGAATAATASIGISVQVCTTAPQCSPGNDIEWASTTAVQSGATVVWRVSITNTGGVALTSIVTNDAGNADCAGAVTAGPLQPGQVTAYICHSDNVTQATTNTASATGTPPSGPNVTSATSSASVTIASGTPDPNAGMSVLVQVCTLAVLTSCDPGNAADWASSATVYTSIIRWRVVIINTGTDPLTGVTAATSLPRSEGDCGGSVPPGTLNAGGVIDYECEIDNVSPPSTFTQTVTASGQPPTGPVITSASSTATVRVAADNPPPGSGISSQLQICVLADQAACDPTNAADWASSATLSSTTARWRVVVTNTGTLALSSIYASDTLAQTDCGGFVAGSLPKGATTQYTCQTTNVTRTTVNSLTVTGNTPPSGVPITSAASTATAVVGSGAGGIQFCPGRGVRGRNPGNVADGHAGRPRGRR